MKRMGQAHQEEHLRALIASASQGDRRAYGKIFRICYEDIYDYIIRRIGDRSDAEDLTMQVFAQGLKAVDTYEERGHSVKAWLYRIAHNTVVDYFRSRRQVVELQEVPEIADLGDIEREYAEREDIRGLYREIRRLPPAQAEVLTLRFVEDRSVAETAMILDKKEVTVRALQFKGIKKLRERMERQSEGVGPEGE